MKRQKFFLGPQRLKMGLSESGARPSEACFGPPGSGSVHQMPVMALKSRFGTLSGHWPVLALQNQLVIRGQPNMIPYRPVWSSRRSMWALRAQCEAPKVQS